MEEMYFALEDGLLAAVRKKRENIEAFSCILGSMLGVYLTVTVSAKR